MPPYLKSAVVYKICIHLAFQRFSADYGLSTDYVCECVCEFVSVCLSFYNMLLPSLKVTNAGYEWCAIVRSQWKFPAHQHSQKNLEFALYSINFFGGLPTSRNIRGSQVFRTKPATFLISGEFFPISKCMNDTCEKEYGKSRSLRLHCAAVFHMQAPKDCTDLYLSLLYSLMLGT